MIRPAALATFVRLREVGYGLATIGAGLWLIALGGYLLTPVGVAIAALGIGWVVLATRRLRFRQAIDAPGVVEVDEGQVGYLGPTVGGYVALPDLVELRLITLRGRRLWRLKQSDGQTLLIPVDAAGADRLFDAFASLPGMDSAALVAALDSVAAKGGRALSVASETRLVWTRPGQRALR
jgi:hypothetical protein